MAIELMDSFGWMKDGAIGYSDWFGDVWDSPPAGGTGITVEDLGNGRKRIRASGYNNGMRGSLKTGGLTEFYVGFFLTIRSGEVDLQGALRFMNASNATVGQISCDSALKPAYYAGGTYFATTAAAQIDVPVHLVFRIIVHSTAGEVHIYRDGILDKSYTGVDTRWSADDLSRVQIGDITGDSFLFWLSDLWIDSNTNHGIAYCMYDPVDSAGSNADFTPTGDTTNHECVDEIPFDDDTTYNRSTLNGDEDRLGHGSTPTCQSIPAVQSIVRARKEPDGANQFKVGCYHSGNHSQGSDRTLSESYVFYSEIFEDVPGGTGWTDAQLQAAETTYENTTSY